MERLKKAIIFICLCVSLSATMTAAVQDQSGYYTVPPVTYAIHDGTALSAMTFTASSARLFYTFLKADNDAENKPLFLFFNGGPGSGTSCGLMGFYTGRKTFDNRITGGGDHYIDNPWSWTQMGNLLYIDARCAGFSYGLLPAGTPRTLSGIFPEFLGRNFNSYIDAADYIRVLLAFLADHPDIQNNPVIIVGESYGGVRATLMLNMLLHYPDYGNYRDIYQDPELVERIQAHYDTVFPEYSGGEVPPSLIAGQFGHQVLIQPAIDSYRGHFDGPMLEQPGSLVYQIAAETGTTFTPCSGPDCDPMSNIHDFIENVADRDIYGCHKPAGWTDSFFDHAGDLLLDSEQFQAITGYDPAAIPELLPAARASAYKFANYPPRFAAGLLPMHQEILALLPSEQKALVRPRALFSSTAPPSNPSFHIPSIFGPLLAFDAYFSSSTRDGFVAYYYLNPTSARGYASYSYHPMTGRKFLRNLLNVRTFITNAKYDLVVYTNALPPAFAMHTNLVSASLHQPHLPTGIPRPGQIEIHYQNGAFGQDDTPVRIIRFPFYSRSSHPVSLTEPGEFFSDVRAWLEDR